MIGATLVHEADAADPQGLYILDEPVLKAMRLEGIPYPNRQGLRALSEQTEAEAQL